MEKTDVDVVVIMGSKSDIPIVKICINKLKKMSITYSINIYSAHRTTAELDKYIHKINSSNSVKVIIAAAGMSATLAGHIASQTTKPVIGIPLSGGKFRGIEALLSTIEMPTGIPVMTVGIDAAENAALAAARILALNDASIEAEIKYLMLEKKESVLEDNEILQSTM